MLLYFLQDLLITCRHFNVGEEKFREQIAFIGFVLLLTGIINSLFHLHLEVLLRFPDYLLNHISLHQRLLLISFCGLGDLYLWLVLQRHVSSIWCLISLVEVGVDAGRGHIHGVERVASLPHKLAAVSVPLHLLVFRVCRQF